ncbi:hypothetical protein MMC30_009287 [Trapelia coarctata]|nr:hypothetical protein [Trapelia coarctata]
MSSDFPLLEYSLTPTPAVDETVLRTPAHRPSPIPIPFQAPAQYLSPYASSNTESNLLSLSVPQPMQRPTTLSGPTITDMVRDVIARAEAKAVKEKEAARGATAKTDVQLPVNSESFVVASTPATEPRNEARTGGRRGRGPRRRGSPLATGTIKMEPNMIDGTDTPGRVRGRGRGGRPRGSRARGPRGSMRGGKRKRSSDEDDESDDSDASETFAPLPTQSRSGRKIFQANTNTPIIKIDDEDAPSPSLLLQPALNILDRTKTKRRRTPGAAAVCKNCGRGHSPASNVIAFCDGCNTPWHQHCHDPPINSEVVQIEEKEWFCADCAVLREERARLEGRVAGEGMSLADKRQYLQTLSQGHLVSLLLHASALYPALPIFEQKATATVTTTAAEASADAEEYYEEEMELPYPKAGNGIVLPPESDDLAFLLDEDITTFSHSWVEPSAPGGFVGMAGPALAVGA